MKLRAEVRRITGKTRHYVAGADLSSERIADPSWVEIAEERGSTYLFRYAASGTLLTDTWHETIELAKRQALFEFEIGEDDWRDVEPVS